MAKKQTIELNVETNAKKVKKEFDQLGGSVENLAKAEDKLKKTNKDLHATFEEVYGEVKPLTGQMGEMEDRLYEMALAGESATKEFHELLTEVGKYRKVQMDTDIAVDAASGTMAQKMGGALQGAASGFAIAQGSMALFGSESEKFEETLIKLNAAMALSQGMQGLREGAKSFRQLSKAIRNSTIVTKTWEFIQGKSAKTTNRVVTAVVADTTATNALSTAKKGLAISTNTAATAMKTLRAALVATGVGALIVGLGFVIEKLMRVEEEIGDIADAEAELEKQRAEALEGFKAGAVAFDEFYTRQIDNLEQTLEINKLHLKKRKADDKEYFDTENTMLDNQVLVWQDYLNTVIEQRKNASLSIEEDEVLEKEEKNIRKKVAEIERRRLKLKLNFEIDAQNKIEALKNKGAGKSINADKKLLSLEREIIDAKLAIIEDAELKELEILNESYRRQAEDNEKRLKNKEISKEDFDALNEAKELLHQKEITRIQEKYFKEREDKRRAAADEAFKIEKERKDNIKNLENEFLNELEGETDIANARLLSEQEIEEQIVKEKYFRLIQMAKEYGLNTEELEANRTAALNAIDDNYTQQEIARQQELADFRVDVAMKSLNAINDLVQALAGENEKAQERAFNVNKAVGIVQTIISTGQAIMKAAAETTDFTPPQALRIANMVAMGAAGAAQVAMIAKQKFSGGGGGGSPGGNFKTPSGSSAQPNFNVVGDSGMNQLAELQMTPTQAYVVSGDITTAQSLDRNKIENATI